MNRRQYSSYRLVRRILACSRPYWPQIAGIFLLSLFATPLALLTPLPLKIAVDTVVGSQPLPDALAAPRSIIGDSTTAALALSAALFVVIASLGQVQKFATSLLRTYTGEQLVLAFRATLFRHAQRISVSYHDTRGTTDALYRVQYDAHTVQWITIDGIIPIVTTGITLLAMIYVTAQIDGQLALVALGIPPALLVLSHLFSPRLRQRWHEAKAFESSAMSVVQETLGAIRVVKAFGQEERERDRFVVYSSQGVRALIRVIVLKGWFDASVNMVVAVATGALLLLGASHVLSGSLTLGELLLVMGYLVQLYAPMQTLGECAASLQPALASAQRAFALLDEAPDVVERSHARHLARATGAISFRRVSFGYQTERPILSDLSFDIGPGTHFGIRGASGAGKTTLVALLMRFYDPSSGQILLDGIPLADYRLADLRNQFAVVLQEPVLFSTSIAENIAYARPDACYEQLVEAAKAANVHDFIVRLPDGYQTQVGDRGMRLSGGERQRVSLARAFLRNAPILILDEPTSAVDMATEQAIMEPLSLLMRGRTSILITHRPSTLRRCDSVVMLERGQVNAADDDPSLTHTIT